MKHLEYSHRHRVYYYQTKQGRRSKVTKADPMWVGLLIPFLAPLFVIFLAWMRTH